MTDILNKATLDQHTHITLYPGASVDGIATDVGTTFNQTLIDSKIKHINDILSQATYNPETIRNVHGAYDHLNNIMTGEGMININQMTDVGNRHLLCYRYLESIEQCLKSLSANNHTAIPLDIQLDPQYIWGQASEL